MTRHVLCMSALLAAVAVTLSACSVESDPSASSQGSSASSGGDSREKTIRIDGSSTVLPVSSAVAEAFQQTHPDVNIRVNKSGTGPGFDKFARGETEINDASRPVKETEAARLKEAGIDFVELKVGIDGLSVVVNPDNDWAEALSIEQLTSIWEKGGSVNTWSDLDPAWPDEPIKLFGPDSESGTYDYFKEATVGSDGELRTDYQESVDDNVLAYNIAEEKYALGYFGYAYLSANSDKLKGVAIAPGSDLAGAVKPTPETIENGTYQPLSRPLFIYVSEPALKRPEMKEFVEFYLSDAGQELVRVKYVPLSADQIAESRQRLADAIAKVAAN